MQALFSFLKKSKVKSKNKYLETDGDHDETTIKVLNFDLITSGSQPI